jgi:O-glycosyl hydrolase
MKQFEEASTTTTTTKKTNKKNIRKNCFPNYRKTIIRYIMKDDLLSS